MVDEVFKFHLENLQKLHTDLEKQMLNFDEVIPYEHQRTAKIYSPRLLNMMLACGPQVEAITRLISTKCGFPDGGIPSLIEKINQKTVLSDLKIVSIPHRLLFTPFGTELLWWDAYNELKHELNDKQFKITYTTVMDAFAALAALHCLAGFLLNSFDDKIPHILDGKNWRSDETMVTIVTANRGRGSYDFWRSLLFEIRSIYTGFGL